MAALISRRVFSLILAPFLLLACGPERPGGGSRPSPRELEARLLRIVEAFESEPPFPGYGAALFDTEGIFWTRAAGLSAVESGRPFDADSLLGVGTLSEIVTAALAIRLSERGRLDLDLPLGPALEGLARADAPRESGAGSYSARLAKVRIREVIRNSTGSDTRFFLSLSDYDPLGEPTRLLSAIGFRDPPFRAEPDGSTLFDVLGAILERSEGLSFDELARRELFLPLGLARSSFQHRASRRDADLRYKSAPPGSYPTRIRAFTEVPVPSGSLRTSLREFGSFFAALLRSASGGRGLLSLEGAELLLDLGPPGEGGAEGHLWLRPGKELSGLGMVRWRWGKLLSHRALVILLPERELGALVLANSWNIIATDRILPLAADLLRACRPELPPAGHAASGGPGH